MGKRPGRSSSGSSNRSASFNLTSEIQQGEVEEESSEEELTPEGAYSCIAISEGELGLLGLGHFCSGCEARSFSEGARAPLFE